MTPLFKALSFLISYPTADLQSAAPEIAALLAAEPRLPSPIKQRLVSLAAGLEQDDLLDLQSRFVDLFDRSRRLSLHLFEHVHGESRERGPAMVALRERYRAAGFDIAANELPDYLPLYLEFLSLRPSDDASAMLGEAAHVLHALAERLAEKGSDYAAVFEALESLTQAQPDEEQLAELRAEKGDDPNDLVALDRAWEEAEVRFGPAEATAGCPRMSGPPTHPRRQQAGVP